MTDGNHRLVVVSNRVGPLSDEGKAGGLAVGLADALRRRGGLWFGWSGEISQEGTGSDLKTEVHGQTSLATIDMTQEEIDGFYFGYANRSLWPLLHYRLDIASFDRKSDRVYRGVNRRFAERLSPLLMPDYLVWVHDYHFFYMGSELRRAGYDGRLGYFLHIPFCPPEMLTALPASHDLVRAMLDYDVVGFQTDGDRRNFVAFCVQELGAEDVDGDRIRTADGRIVRASAFPIGIDADGFAEFALSEEAREHEAMVNDISRGRHQIVGVDRMDYSKGIVERFRGFEQLLEDYPDERGQVQFLQVAPLSRSELEAYADLRNELEGLAGNINGRFATLDWNPIQILVNGFTRRALAGIYRAAQVCMVTPLRDGMNLVAKEFIAAQDPDDPGVLILSRFAGARAELPEALIVNPYSTDNIARAASGAENAVGGASRAPRRHAGTGVPQHGAELVRDLPCGARRPAGARTPAAVLVVALGLRHVKRNRPLGCRNALVTNLEDSGRKHKIESGFKAKGHVMAKNTICIWYEKDAEAAARFYAETFPDSAVSAVHRAPGDYPSGKKGDVLTVEFTVAGVPCIGLNGGPAFKHSEAFSFQIATDDQEETDRYWNAIVGHGGQESACGWCKDKWGISWQITPRVLTDAMAAGGDEAKRAFGAMMTMKKIDVAAIEAARRG